MALSLISLVAFAIPFYLYGLASARASTAPPVGFGEPCNTFWGFGWPEAGGTFIWWNLKGYGLFLGVLMLCGGIRQTWHHFPRILIVSAITYLLSLTPFCLTGALLHGWCGGYVQNACQDRLNVLSLALCDYADAHNGLLPEVSDMKSLLDALEPYTATNMDHIRFGFPLEICPVGGAYERHPRIFVWNKKYSGLNLHDVNYDHNSEYMELRPITCPYHDWGSRDWLWTVLNRLDERNGSKKQATEAP